MVNQCCVESCKNTSKDCPMHRFPHLDKEVYRIWVSRINNPRIESLDPSKVNAQYRVCHNHFSHYCLLPQEHRTNRRFLKARSLPTLNLPGFNEESTLDNSVLPWPITDEIQTQSVQIQETTYDKDIGDNPESAAGTSAESATGTSVIANENKTATIVGVPDDNINISISSPITTPKSRKDLRRKINLLKCVDTRKSVQLTPKAKKLYDIAKNFKRIAVQLDKENISNRRRLEEAHKLMNTEDFIRSTVNSVSCSFILSQLRLQKLKPKGRRYSMKEKIFALTLYKNAPRNYRLLQKIFALPSKYTLSRLLSSTPFQCGINKEVMQTLKKSVMKLDVADRYCALLFDEVSLSPSLTYIPQFDEFEGFEDVGNERRRKFADHAAVFMAEGIRKQWKQPLCFYFIESNMKKDELVAKIKEIISHLIKIGLKPVASVCDQHHTNMAAYKQLKRQTNEDCIKNNTENRYFGFVVDEHEIIPLFDPPHLLKGLRNNLLRYNIKFRWKQQKDQIANWQDIVNLYENDDPIPDFKMCAKLTDKHIYEEKMNKMKVNLAAQVFSQQVSGLMRNLSRLGSNCSSSTAVDTADFLLFGDTLFDSVNGDKISSTKKYRCAIHDTSPHMDFYNEAIEVLKNMKCISGKKEFQVPTIKNWIETLKGFKYLWKKLSSEWKQFDKSKGINILKSANQPTVFLNPRSLNQDPLENLFGCIRSHGVRNINPTCTSFRQSFTSLLVNNFLSRHSPDANCELDHCEGALDTLESLINPTRRIDSDSVEVNLETLEPNANCSYLHAYIAGFMAKKILKFTKSCKECKKQLLGDRNDDPVYSWIKIRTFTGKSLLFPSSNFMILFNKYIHNLTIYTEKFAEVRNLKYLLMSLYKVTDFEYFTCVEHDIFGFFKKYLTKFYLFTFGNNINKSLKGLDENKPKDKYKPLRLLACDKYKKRRKFKK